MPVTTKPPGPRTGYGNPGCYARGLEDCDRKLSREHFISKKLLERMVPLTVEGLAWSIERRQITPNSLAAKNLCVRHNNALSGLDDKITDFFDALVLWHRRQRFGEVAVEGEDLERWGIKALLGFATSGAALGPDGKKLLVRSAPDGYVRALFGEAELGEGCGLYLTDKRVPPDRIRRGVSLSIVTDTGEHTGQIVGLAAALADLPFVVTFAAGLPSLQCYRPRGIHLVGSGKLRLDWSSSRGGGMFVAEHDQR
jgi:hypothetical protein